MKVIKPELTLYAMCIYRFTLGNGFYYYGATTNLGERIYEHLKRIRNKTASKEILIAIENSTYINFEVIRFVNDRSKLQSEEEKYLSRHIGLPQCLNTEIKCTSAFKRGKAIFKIAKLDFDGKVLEIFETSSIAAKALGVSRRNIEMATLIRYPKTKYALRKINNKGDISIPINPLRHCLTLSKSVVQYDKNMNFIATYYSIEEAARKTGCARKGISNVMKNKQKRCKGFIFLAA